MIIATIVAALGGGTGLYAAGRAKSVKVEPQPLEVRNADARFVTAAEHKADLERVYDKVDKNTEALNQLVGLVQGIRDLLTNSISVSKK